MLDCVFDDAGSQNLTVSTGNKGDRNSVGPVIHRPEPQSPGMFFGQVIQVESSEANSEAKSDEPALDGSADLLNNTLRTTSSNARGSTSDPRRPTITNASPEIKALRLDRMNQSRLDGDGKMWVRPRSL